MKNTSNVALVILITLVLAGGAYWYFFMGGEQAPLTSNTERNQAQIQFQTLVGKLTPITFNTSIFSDPRFNALVNIATPITPETVGRFDPFAPVTNISGK